MTAMNDTLSVLRKLEWSGRVNENFGHGYTTVTCCPVCKRKNYGDQYSVYQGRGHKENCSLKIAIEREAGGYGI